MPRHTVSYTALTHQVLREAPEPLPFAEIMARVAAIMPITTKNPKQTIRNAISTSPLILPTGDGRYGWKPRLLNGARLRLPLDDAALGGSLLTYSEEARDALYPAFFGPQSYSDRSPVVVALPDGTFTQLTLEHVGAGHWGSRVSSELRAWLARQNAQVGDDLLLEVLDGDARHYGLSLQRRTERDEGAIAERNEQATKQALELAFALNRERMLFEVVSQLLARGFYHHPLPPDPLHTLLALSDYGLVLGDRAVLNGLEADTTERPVGLELHGGVFGTDFIARLAPLLQEAGGNPARLPAEVRAELEQFIADALPGILPLRGATRRPARNEPDELPPEYEPGPNRRPRPSQAASRGPAPVVTLRVTHRERPQVWRDIAIAEDQTLEDLHLAIQAAYGWADDHLYSFFMSGRLYDNHTEVGSPFSDAPRFTHQVSIGSLKLKPERHFLYLFDYGDDHMFDVTVLARDGAAPMGSYPRVVGKQGRAPNQYGRWRG
jgi:hypothetical protein